MYLASFFNKAYILEKTKSTLLYKYDKKGKKQYSLTFEELPKNPNNVS